MGPVRTCAGCRRVRPQAALLRVARRTDGAVIVDAQHGIGSPGRGAYVCMDANCVELALRSGRLRRALRCPEPLPDGIRSELMGMATGGSEG